MFRLHCAAFRSDLLLHWLAGSSVASTGTSFHLFPFVSVQSWCAEMVHRSLPNMLLCVFFVVLLGRVFGGFDGNKFPFISVYFHLFPFVSVHSRRAEILHRLLRNILLLVFSAAALCC